VQIIGVVGGGAIKLLLLLTERRLKISLGKCHPESFPFKGQMEHQILLASGFLNATANDLP